MQFSPFLTGTGDGTVLSESEKTEILYVYHTTKCETLNTRRTSLSLNFGPRAGHCLVARERESACVDAGARTGTLHGPCPRMPGT